MLETLLTLSGLKKRWPVVYAEDVRAHNDRDSLWIICGTSVYDVTPILGVHPGGDAALLRRGGGLRDCREDHEFHSRYARRVWDECKIAELTPEDAAKLPRLPSACGATQGHVARSQESLNDNSTNGNSSGTFTCTVETIPSTSATPGHYRVHDEPHTNVGYRYQP